MLLFERDFHISAGKIIAPVSSIVERIFIVCADRIINRLSLDRRIAPDICDQLLELRLFVDPISVIILRRRDHNVRSKGRMECFTSKDEKIVAIAMRSVPGVVGMKGGLINRIQDAFGATDARKGVSVEVTPESAVKVNVSVFIEYGAYAPQVFEDVKKAIVKQVTGMTGLAVAGVNLRIEDVLTPEEVAARNSEPEAAAPAPAPALETVEEYEAAEEVVEEGSDA